MVFHIAVLLSDHGTHFIVKKKKKTQLQSQLGGNTMWGWKNVLQGGVYALNTSIVKNQVSKNQGDVSQCYYSLLALRFNGKIFAPFSYNHRRCWSRYISSKRRNASTIRHNSDSPELEVKMSTQPL